MCLYFFVGVYFDQDTNMYQICLRTTATHVSISSTTLLTYVTLPQGGALRDRPHRVPAESFPGSRHTLGQRWSCVADAGPALTQRILPDGQPPLRTAVWRCPPLTKARQLKTRFMRSGLKLYVYSLCGPSARQSNDLTPIASKVLKIYHHEMRCLS